MIYVTFTCLPSRIDNIDTIFESLLLQTKTPDIIIINYPEKCLRLNMNYDIDNLKNKINNSQLVNKIYLNITKDYGPITKIYPIIHLNFIKDDDIIIVIDDDNCYNKYLIEELYNNFILNDQKEAICVSGLLYPRTLNSNYYCVTSGFDCELMEASFGYIIKKSFLKNDLSNWVIDENIENYIQIKENNFENCFLSDDYLISRYLDIHQIKKRVLNFTPLIHKQICFQNFVNSNDALSSLGFNLNKYVIAEKELIHKGLI
jgi:hypothetical protein